MSSHVLGTCKRMSSAHAAESSAGGSQTNLSHFIPFYPGFWLSFRFWNWNLCVFFEVVYNILYNRKSLLYPPLPFTSIWTTPTSRGPGQQIAVPMHRKVVLWTCCHWTFRPNDVQHWIHLRQKKIIQVVRVPRFSNSSEKTRDVFQNTDFKLYTWHEINNLSKKNCHANSSYFVLRRSLSCTQRVRVLDVVDHWEVRPGFEILTACIGS